MLSWQSFKNDKIVWSKCSKPLSTFFWRYNSLQKNASKEYVLHRFSYFSTYFWKRIYILPTRKYCFFFSFSPISGNLIIIHKYELLYRYLRIFSGFERFLQNNMGEMILAKQKSQFSHEYTLAFKNQKSSFLIF